MRECDTLSARDLTRTARWRGSDCSSCESLPTQESILSAITPVEKQGSEARNCLPIQLNSKLTRMYGATMKHTRLYPKILDSESVSKLCLSDMVATYRAGALYLGKVNLMVVRGFKVALALVFADCVLVFLSHDLILQNLPSKATVPINTYSAGVSKKIWTPLTASLSLALTSVQPSAESQFARATLVFLAITRIVLLAELSDERERLARAERHLRPVKIRS
ncbi:hypothetical protein C8F01DRAFT_285706 [Mycena amicta]|nr:hypothetical protein C8F01DRAFT_285706 [Mycena amicta]